MVDDKWVEEEKYQGPEEAREDARLVQLISQPVYDEYHSFAGEFYVDGKVVYLVAENSVKMEKSESVESWSESEVEL